MTPPSVTPVVEAPVVEAAGIDVVRAGRYLLAEVDVRVEPGEHWVLLGPNGAGKSTLLAILGARMFPTRGEVSVLGARLGRVDVRELRSHIGHVDPRWRIDVPLNAHDVVLSGLTGTPEPDPRRRYTAVEHDQADALLATLGMAQRRESVWPLMSQGERGRVLIARALIARPRLLLLDEPATGLDLAAREILLGALDRLRIEIPEMASVLVTHHLEDLPASTSHALLLREGRVVASGPVEQALTSQTISATFDHPVTLHRTGGRWSAVSP